MSDKNFMSYGDSETVLTGFANSIKSNKKGLSDLSYEYYIRNGLKNLAVINQESSTMNTINFTNNGDGTWTVNGTNSKSSSAYCFPMIVDPGYFKPGRYTLTGIPANAENISLTLRYNGGSGNTSIATINGSTNSVTFDITAAQVAAATVNFNLMIGVPANATVNNVTVSPMIVYEEVGNISNTFEKSGKTNKELATEKQNKTLDTALTINGVQQTTVEGALGALNGLDFHLDQTATLSTSTTTTITFTNAAITTSSLIDLACSEWGLVPDSVSVANGSCTVIMPKVDSASTVTVRIYVR